MQGAASPFKGDSPSSPPFMKGEPPRGLLHKGVHCFPPLILHEAGLAHACPRAWRLGKRLAGWAAVLVARVRPMWLSPLLCAANSPFWTVSGTSVGECCSLACGCILGHRADDCSGCSCAGCVGPGPQCSFSRNAEVRSCGLRAALFASGWTPLTDWLPGAPRAQGFAGWAGTDWPVRDGVGRWCRTVKGAGQLAPAGVGLTGGSEPQRPCGSNCFPAVSVVPRHAGRRARRQGQAHQAQLWRCERGVAGGGLTRRASGKLTPPPFLRLLFPLSLCWAGCCWAACDSLWCRCALLSDSLPIMGPHTFGRPAGQNCGIRTAQTSLLVWAAL